MFTHKKHDRSSEAQLPDDALAALACAGDQHALEALFGRHYPAVLRYLGRLTHDAELAADLTQNVMLAAAQHPPALAEGDSAAPWLYRVARNEFVSACRRRRVRRAVSLDELADRPGNEAMLGALAPGIGQWDERELFERALEQLSPADREILYLRHELGHASKQIATILEIAPAAARQRLHRAEERFRCLYEENL